jgi:hypothetical protein
MQSFISIWVNISTKFHSSVFQPFSIRGTSCKFLITWRNLNVPYSTIFSIFKEPRKELAEPLGWKTLLHSNKQQSPQYLQIDIVWQRPKGCVIKISLQCLQFSAAVLNWPTMGSFYKINSIVNSYKWQKKLSEYLQQYFVSCVT